MPKPKLPFKNFKWTPKLAYIVGLLATDGNLSGDGRHIIMCSSDKSLLRTFRSCLDLKNKIGKTYDRLTKRPSYRIQFGNIQLYNWLISIGVTPAKTYTIGAIKIPDKFFRDFLRGHLDGDGTIFTYTDRYNSYKGRIYTNQRIYTKFYSVSKTHVIWLYDKISVLAEVKGALLCRPPRSYNHVSMWEIKFAKKASIELWKWIYYKKRLPCLKRKMILAQRLSKLITNEKRRKYTKIS
ncbi:MAG: hypothetical protein ABIC36_02055 [bacterium]